MNGLPRLLQLGDHLCQFFATADELGEVLVPYFKEGLERNEACIWITSGAYDKERALSDMRSAANSFDKRYAAGQLKILAHDEWYLANGRLKTDDLVAKWLHEKDTALAAGYAGLRLSGNVSFLENADWPEFMAYERAVTEAFRDQPVAALCSYSQDQCSADMAIEVMDCHTFTLRRRSGHWDVFGLHDDQAHLTRHVQGIELRRLVEDCLSIYLRAKPHSIGLDGVRVLLSARKAHDLGLIFHGLATNAAEFGALSMPEGRLNVQWRVVGTGSRRLCVEWVESGVGNPLTCDATLLIAATVENCRRIFTAAGMACTFELALD